MERGDLFFFTGVGTRGTIGFIAPPSTGINNAKFRLTNITINDSEVIGDEEQFIWDGKDKFYRDVSNGVYLCRLTLGGKVYWTKLMVVHS